MIILHILVITKNKLQIFARFVRIALNQLDTSLRQISLCQNIHFIFSDVSNMRPEKRQAMVANVKYCYIICNFHIFKHIQTVDTEMILSNKNSRERSIVLFDIELLCISVRFPQTLYRLFSVSYSKKRCNLWCTNQTYIYCLIVSNEIQFEVCSF